MLPWAERGARLEPPGTLGYSLSLVPSPEGIFSIGTDYQPLDCRPSQVESELGFWSGATP